MLDYIILAILIVSIMPIAILINNYTNDERYLSKFIKYLLIFLLLLLIFSFFKWEKEVTATLLSMSIICLISYLKKK